VLCWLFARRPAERRTACNGHVESDILLILMDVSAGSTHESVCAH
jgi:hypothetical protein